MSQLFASGGQSIGVSVSVYSFVAVACDLHKHPYIVHLKQYVNYISVKLGGKKQIFWGALLNTTTWGWWALDTIGDFSVKMVCVAVR